jgi:hypothetical protein
MAYTLEDPDAEDRHVTQYFEMFGNRGIYHKRWTAVTHHSTPWLTRECPSFDEDVWELYSTNEDWSQTRDLSKEMPDKPCELQQLFMIEAAKDNVFPLDDQRNQRFNASIAGRPDLAGDRKTTTFYPGMTHFMENTVLNVKNRSHTITAEVEVSEGKTDGVIVAQGGRFAGWSLYVKTAWSSTSTIGSTPNTLASKPPGNCPQVPSTSAITLISTADSAEPHSFAGQVSKAPGKVFRETRSQR